MEHSSRGREIRDGAETLPRLGGSMTGSRGAQGGKEATWACERSGSLTARAVSEPDMAS
jgi:hypothetical protein